MKNFTFRNILLISILVATCSYCISGTGNKLLQTDRQPAVAGKFYPGNKNSLVDSLKAMFKRAVPKKTNKPVLAIICPHAGYIFSGDVATSSFSQIEKKHYKDIFVIGSSHHALYDGASIYDEGDFITPLGKVKVDKELARSLIKSNKCFTDDIAPHNGEHSIEVQLPFLQYLLGDDINLVPILVGGQAENDCKQIANALKPYFNSDNLFVISTDFSHYPSYYDAQTSDKLTAGAITTNSPEKLLQMIHEIGSSGIKNLQTALCGWTSVLTFLNITNDIPNLNFSIITSKNSGDTPFGNKNEVVGYVSIAIYQGDKKDISQNDFLSKDDKDKLLKIARETISEYVSSHVVPDIDSKKISPGLLQPCGAFVTLKENGELRGCIGNFSAEKPLYQTVQDMAIAAATNDYRFNPVTKDEIDKLEIEISVLTPMKKIKSIDEIVLGKHGIYIKKGTSGGTFLPQVANETNWTKEEFLGHCARDKAGLGWDGWKGAEIFTYEAIVFGEKK
jgi:hypothetical protein